MAIDWAFVGIGWIGHEINYLVSHRLTLLDNPGRAEARERDHAAFESYVEGLRDGGWRDDPRLAWLGQVARKAILPTSLWVLQLLDESRYAWAEQAIGRSMEKQVDSLREQIRHHLLGYWEDEAWQLLEELDLGS